MAGSPYQNMAGSKAPQNESFFGAGWLTSRPPVIVVVRALPGVFVVGIGVPQAKEGVAWGWECVGLCKAETWRAIKQAGGRASQGKAHASRRSSQANGRASKPAAGQAREHGCQQAGNHAERGRGPPATMPRLGAMPKPSAVPPPTPHSLMTSCGWVFSKGAGVSG